LFVCALWLFRQPDGTDGASTAPAPEPPLARTLFLYFAALLFLYGGLETCLSGWLTTYALRYGQTSLVLSEYTMVLLLCGLTAGRALASWLLLRMQDSMLQRIALVLSAALAAALATAHRAGLIATLAVLLGVTLAPIFPATFALLMAHRPPARAAGIVIAASGIGAAALPSLIGIISTRTGSLQTALVVPVAAAIAMLLLSLIPQSTP
jgi:fucose permease